MKRKFFLALLVILVIVFMKVILIRIAQNKSTSQRPDTKATFSTHMLVIQDDFSRSAEYGPLTNTYVDADHDFSLQYPDSFIEVSLPEWKSVVDNDTKAQIWIGFCSADCSHLARFPFSHSESSYSQDATVTWKDSPDIPLGEGRRIHVLSNREFTTEHGTHAIEQLYETTGFNVATGEPATLYCAEDTPCESSKPALRYLFFSEGKAPYVMAVRAPLYLIRSIANTVSY